MVAQAAPAAPLVGPGISLVLGLWLIAALLGAIMLVILWDNTIGAAMKAIGDALNVGVWKLKVGAGGPILDAEQYIRKQLGAFVLANEKAFGLWWHANVQIVRYLGDALVDFGNATHEAIYNLINGTIPATVTAHTKPLTGAIALGDSAAAARDRAEAQARTRGIDATNRDLLAEKLARERGIDNVGAKARAYTDARVGRVQGQIAAERRYSHRVLNRRLTWLEKALGVGALSGIAIAALTRVFPYWQCSGFRRFARGVCRSGITDWTSLLGLLAFVVVALDPERVLHVAEDASDELDTIVRQMAGLN